jgi:hypothetical protein
MTYATVESTMQTVLAGITGLSTSLVTLGDESVLDKGVAQCVIIEPGGETVTPTIATISENSYDVRVSIYARFTTKAATHAAFVTFRDAIISRIRHYFPDIGNANIDNPNLYYLESIATDGNPVDIAMQPNTGPVFRGQTIVVTVRETGII